MLVIVHYICFVKTNKRWIFYNDSTVQEDLHPLDLHAM